MFILLFFPSPIRFSRKYIVVIAKLHPPKVTTALKHLDVRSTKRNMYSNFRMPTLAKLENLDEVLSFDVDEAAN